MSTRQIAEAAGVAEGTIFRAFGSKEALFSATIANAFDPTPVAEALAAIDRELPLRERMTTAVDVLQERLRSVFGLLLAMRLHRPPDHDKDSCKDGSGDDPRAAGNALVHGALADVLVPDAARLRYPLEEVARRIRLVAFSGTHPLISDGRPLTAEEIVDFVLDGVRIQEPEDL